MAAEAKPGQVKLTLVLPRELKIRLDVIKAKQQTSYDKLLAPVLETFVTQSETNLKKKEQSQ